MISELRNVIDKTQGEIKSSGLPEIYGNPKYIHLLFHHLISNTLKFCKNDTPPRISINSQRTVDHQWQISVKDNGIGIEKTFKPFEKLNPKDGHNGTGMGLTICRKIAEDHSGTIIAQSNPEGKTVFILTLPKKNRTSDSSHPATQINSVHFFSFMPLDHFPLFSIHSETGCYFLCEHVHAGPFQIPSFFPTSKRKTSNHQQAFYNCP